MILHSLSRSSGFIYYMFETVSFINRNVLELYNIFHLDKILFLRLQIKISESELIRDHGSFKKCLIKL